MQKLAQGIDNLRNFFGEVKVELLKCSWPTRAELFGSATVVVVAVIILAAYVGACDVLNMGLLKAIIR